jgi:Tol biopolymer transport system component
VQNNTINFVGTSVQTLNPSVSGDGSVVAYEDYGQTTHGVIAITDVANGGTQFINTNMQFERNPDISADGNYVAFESSTNLTDEQIFVFDRVHKRTPISVHLSAARLADRVSRETGTTWCSLMSSMAKIILERMQGWLLTKKNSNRDRAINAQAQLQWPAGPWW